MFGLNRGVRLCARGLSLHGEQVVKVDNGFVRDEIFILNGNTIESYMFSPTSENGFRATDSGSVLLGELLPKVIDGAKIMEIAGGDSIKVRYDTGQCFTCERKGYGDFLISEIGSVARVTKHHYYTIPDGSTASTAVPYYKSGGGTAQLVPLLTQDGDTVGDIVAVFEGKDIDHIVRLSDVPENAPIVGFVGGLHIIGDGTNNSIVLPSGNVSISGFGTIIRNGLNAEPIHMVSHIATNGNTNVDYSDYFSPSHYAYIEQKRVNSSPNWTGFGATGYVVDAGDTANMDVGIGGETSSLGTSGATLADVVDFVVVDGAFKMVSGDVLVDINMQDLTGVALINFVCANDMNTYLISDANTVTTEPFAVNGYSFGYGAGRLVDADLNAL